MTRVKVCLPRVAITHRGVETRKEIFIVGIAADGRQPDVKTVSQTYKGIRRHDSLPLQGDGIVLYPWRDPNGDLALSFSVIESDKKQREVLNGLADSVASFDTTSGKVAKLLAKLLGTLGVFDDDELLTRKYTLSPENNYQVGPDDRLDTEIGNKKVNCTLRIYVEP